MHKIGSVFSVLGIPVIPAMLFIASHVHVSGAEEPFVLWQEDFEEYSEGPMDRFGEETLIVKEDGKTFLRKESASTQFFFNREIHKEGADTWNNIRTRVRFRFHEISTLSMVVKARGDRLEVPYLWYYVWAREDGIGLSCHGIPDEYDFENDERVKSMVPFVDTAFPDLASGIWYDMTVDSGENLIKVTLTTPDGLSETWDFKTFQGTGFSGILLRSATDIDEFVVEQLPEMVTASE